MKKIHRTLALPFVSVVVSCATTPPPPPPPPPPAPKAEVKPVNQIDDANRLFTKGDHAAALAGYDRILQSKPDDPSARFNRAVALQHLGRRDEAQKAYEQILAKDENDIDAILNLGAILKDEGKIDEAMAIYKKALKQDEFNADLLNNLSVLHRKKKQYKEAVAALRKLLMRDQDNIDAYKNLALVHYDQKQYVLAQTILENARKMATEQKKEDPDIYVNLGMVYLASQENGKAMAAFKTAVGIQPNHVVANYNIGALALGHRDYQLAAKAYGVVAKAWPDRFDVHASLGYAYQGLEQYDEASKELELAQKLKLQNALVKADPNDEEQLSIQTIIVLQSAGKTADALAKAEEYMRVKGITCGPDDVEGFCGRYLGIKTQLQMEKDAANAPPPEEEKKAKDVDQSKIFTDQPAEGDVPAEGETPPAEGQPPPEGQTPPAEGDAAPPAEEAPPPAEADKPKP